MEGRKTDKIFILRPMNSSLTILLQGEILFPIMGERLDSKNTLVLDFSKSNKNLHQIDLHDTAKFSDYVFEQIHKAGKKYGIGGYLEDRAIYSRSKVFASKKDDFRNIHLGVDIWTEALTPVYAPLKGKVHSFKNNKGFGDYGATIILEHTLKEVTLYSLYGHLALNDLEYLYVGKEFNAGDLLCHLGPFPENGDWPPHLHFQLIWDLSGFWGDFPGVCFRSEIEKYRSICPDPYPLVGYSPM